jgi:hypothetical protein
VASDSRLRYRIVKALPGGGNGYLPHYNWDFQLADS